MELIELTIVCKTCGKRKSFKKFNKMEDGRFGIRRECKKCRKIYKKAYYNANSDIIKIKSRIYIKLNKKETKVRVANYYKNNKDKIKTQKKVFNKANPKAIKTNRKKYYNKQKLKSDFKVNSCISTGIRQSLKNGNGKNGKHWETLVPYTINDLIKRLKRTLPKGYKWKNYINGKTDLQIDHKIPLAVHNFKSHTDIDFQRCWALKNLQLLPAQDNRIKHAKLTKHFQPSLLL